MSKLSALAPDEDKSVADQESFSCAEQPIGPGSIVLIRSGTKYLVARCLAATPQVCLVEIGVIRRITNRKPPTIIDPELLSDSTEWPPAFPDDFPLTIHPKGYQAHMSGRTRWVCSRKSPREAYGIYLNLSDKFEKERQAQQASGSKHIAVGWDRVFVHATAPAEVAASACVRTVSRAMYAPTTTKPTSISKIFGVRLYPESVPRKWCIYFLCLMGHVVYVGQTKNLGNRLRSHRNDKKFDAAYFLKCHGGRSSNLEEMYIRTLRPAYNIQMNPDRPKIRGSGKSPTQETTADDLQDAASLPIAA